MYPKTLPSILHPGVSLRTIMQLFLCINCIEGGRLLQEYYFKVQSYLILEIALFYPHQFILIWYLLIKQLGVLCLTKSPNSQDTMLALHKFKHKV